MAATYLLHYAPSKEIMSGMCRSMHDALVPGGRLVSICLAPDANFTDPSYYRPYGFEMASRGGEGDEATVTSVMPEMPFTLKTYAWSRASYEGALTEAGFKDIRWFAPQISPRASRSWGATTGRLICASPTPRSSPARHSGEPAQLAARGSIGDSPQRRARPRVAAG